MSWRFKVSKYKNTTPVVPKPEHWIRDLTIGSFQTYGRNITASAKFMAFNWDSVGNSVSVLPLNDCGRKSKNIPLLYAHSDTVTDMDFSPFDDHLLVTGSQDCTVKLWTIAENGLESSISEPQINFNYKQRRVENVGFHPTADFCIYSTSYSTLTIWDLIRKQSIVSESSQHKDVIQSVAWNLDGKLCATTCKDKIVRILDPRSAHFVEQSAPGHQNLSDSRIVWLGDYSKVLTTGFDAARVRQVFIRDLRNFTSVEKTLEFSCSTGILIPLYDVDTKLLFLAGKGDTSITLWEALDKEPFLIEGLRHSGEQTKNVCLVPKRALNFMQAEVDRVLQLTGNSIIPIMYQIPRKTYRDFHADLYPDIYEPKTTLNAQRWFEGQNVARLKISIDPKNSIKIYRGELLDVIQKAPKSEPNELMKTSKENCDAKIIEKDQLDEPRLGPKPFIAPKTNIEPLPIQITVENGVELNGYDKKDDNFERNSSQRSSNSSIAERRRLYEKSESTTVIQDSVSPIPFRRKESLTKSMTTRKPLSEMLTIDSGQKIVKQQSLDLTPKRTLTVFGRVSKFRHLKGTAAHKSQCIENIRNISRQIPGECDGFQANACRVAVPLSGQGGKIAVLELSKVGRLQDGVIPSLVHGINVMDFQWDPFDSRRLTVACDDGTVSIWHIPETGLTEPTNQPKYRFAAHFDKLYFIKFHPLAENVLATGSADYTIKIWDLSCGSQMKILLIGHSDVIFSFAWSPCGEYAATVSKDSKIRVYKPRYDSEPISEATGLAGTRGARLIWALNGRFLVLTGFDKVSERQIVVFNVNKLQLPLNSFSLDVSPSILIPFYDEDSSTLFVTGKGDSTIYTFEIIEESPFISALSHHRCSTLHQGLSFVSKNSCDVGNVEFAKAFRLTNNSIEPISFTVPRIKSDLFQDDLFPPTRVTWQPTISAEEWFDGNNKQPVFVSLKPNGMDSLSDISNTPQSQSIQTVLNDSKRNSSATNYELLLQNKFGEKREKTSMIETLKKAFDDVQPDDEVEVSDSNSDEWH